MFHRLVLWKTLYLKCHTILLCVMIDFHGNMESQRRSIDFIWWPQENNLFRKLIVTTDHQFPKQSSLTLAETVCAESILLQKDFATGVIRGMLKRKFWDILSIAVQWSFHHLWESSRQSNEYLTSSYWFPERHGGAVQQVCGSAVYHKGVIWLAQGR